MIIPFFRALPTVTRAYKLNHQENRLRSKLNLPSELLLDHIYRQLHFYSRAWRYLLPADARPLPVETMTLLINDFRMDYSESCPEAQADEFERPPYKNPQHAGKAFDMLNLLRKQNLLCK